MADGGGRDRLGFELTAVGRRLAICRELLGTKRGEVSQQRKVELMPRARALLRLLLPGEAGQPRQTDVLFSRAAAPGMVAEVIESAKYGSDAAKTRAALLVRDIIKMAESVQKVGMGVGGPRVAYPPIPDDFLKVEEGVPGNDAHAMPVVREAKALGALPEGLQARIKAAIEANPERYLTAEQLAAEFPEQYAEYERTTAEYAATYDAYRNLFKQAPDAPATIEARERWRDATARNDAAREKLVELNNFVLAKRRHAVTSTVTSYMADFMGASDVDEDRAKEWASENVVITKRAAARLKKLGYAPDQVMRDAAEFYRLARGRIEKVVIDSQGDRRANATDVDEHGTAGRINLGSGFDKRVLWHELGHHIEADPVAAAAARLFIRLRSKDGGKLHSLRKLTGIRAYGSSEVAYADGFFNPYVGKVYRHGHTEVFSMGLESFSDPTMLARRIAVDPETFEFVTGYLRSPKTALQNLHLAMRQSMREGNEEIQETAEQLAKRIVAEQVEKVKGYRNGDDLPEGYRYGTAYLGKIMGFIEPERGEHCYALTIGKWRHPRTRRVAKMYKMVRIPLADTNGRIEMPLEGYPMDEPEIAKLALAFWRQNGVVLSYESVASGNVVLEE